jgi:DNA-binding transcriptional ArsR family regulator
VTPPLWAVEAGPHLGRNVHDRRKLPDGTVRLILARTAAAFLNLLVDNASGPVYVVLNQSVEEARRCAVDDDQLSKVFAALADPTRRDMVARLTDGDATVGQLAEPYDVSVQAVSKHLKVLEDAGLVTRSRDAQRRPVHLEAEVFDLMTKWIERYRRQAEERYRRLDDVLARIADETPDQQPNHHGEATA